MSSMGSSAYHSSTRNILKCIAATTFMALVLTVMIGNAASATVRNVPGTYSKIQTAVDVANPGDTIEVSAGTYKESVLITKQLTVIGVGNPIIDAEQGVRSDGRRRAPIIIEASDCVIDGLTLINSERYSDSGGVVIEGKYGTVGHITITNCISYNNTNGISVDWSAGNNIFTNNQFYQNSWFGLDVESDSNDLIAYNSIHNNGYSGVRISGSNNTIDSNTIFAQAVDANACGLSLSGYDNTIKNNDISGNTNAILFSGQHLTIKNNRIANNSCGIYLNGSYCSYNHIYNNSFINNLEQVDQGIYSINFNFWDNGYPLGGNFWSGFSGADLLSGPFQNLADADGIIDSPYVIDIANQDKYPYVIDEGWPSDQNGPITTITADPPSPNGWNFWYSTTPTITVTSSEVGTIYCSWDSSNGPWTAYSGPFSALEGEHTLFYYSIDEFGTVESGNSQEFKVDTIAPSGFSLVAPNNNTITNNNLPLFTWTNSSDTNSGLLKYELNIDNQIVQDIVPSRNSETPDVALSEGSHNWSMKVYDEAGNTTDAGPTTRSISIDPPDVISSWSSEIPIESAPFTSAGVADPAIAVDGNNVYATYILNNNIYFNYSTNIGQNWQGGRALTTFSLDNVETTYEPAIAVNGNKIYIVWAHCSIPSGGDHSEIYFKQSLDGGATWGPDICLTHSANPPASGYSINPYVKAAGNNVYVCYNQESPEGTKKLCFIKSSDCGQTWSAENEIAQGVLQLQSARHVMEAGNSSVHLVYIKFLPGEFALYYRRSLDFGVTWEPEKRMIPEQPAYALTPTISRNGSNIYIGWAGSSSKYVMSEDDGATWGEAKGLMQSFGVWGPLLLVSGNQVFNIGWGNSQPFLMVSDNQGALWSNIAVIPTSYTPWSANNDENIDFTVSAGKIHMLYRASGGQYGVIYYMNGTVSAPPNLLPPVAEANGPYTGKTGASVIFSADGSDPAGGTIVSYQWDFDGDGVYDASSPDPTTTHQYNESGTYTVKLKVTDSEGFTDEDTSTATISTLVPSIYLFVGNKLLLSTSEQAFVDRYSTTYPITLCDPNDISLSPSVPWDCYGASMVVVTREGSAALWSDMYGVDNLIQGVINNSIPFLELKTGNWILFEWGLGMQQGATNFPDSDITMFDPGTSICVQNASSPIMQGFNNGQVVQVTNTSGNLGAEVDWNTGSNIECQLSSAQQLAYLNSKGAQYTCVLSIPPGTMPDDGWTTSPPSIGGGAFAAVPTTAWVVHYPVNDLLDLTASGWLIMDNAVEFLLNGQPNPWPTRPTLHGPATSVDGSFTVFGQTSTDADIKIFDENALEVGSGHSDNLGNWNVSLSVQPQATSIDYVYTAKAYKNLHESQASLPITVTVGATVPEIGITEADDGGTDPPSQPDPITNISTFTSNSWLDMNIRIPIANAENVESVTITVTGLSQYGGDPVNQTIALSDSDNDGIYIATIPEAVFPFGPGDYSITASITSSEGSFNQEVIKIHLIDPSGYVYDNTTGNRIEGVSVTLYRQNPATLIFEAMDPVTQSDYMEPDENPVTTDSDGHYAWDVAPGTYKVFVEKTGYISAWSSEVTIIDMPVTDLNVGLDAAPVKVGRYEQLEPEFTFSGTGWTNWSSGEYSMGSTKYSNQAGDYAEFTFTGTSFYFITGMTNNRGIVKLYIDDVPITNGNYGLPGDTGTNKSGIDLYWSNGLPQRTAYYKEGLSTGQHIVRIEVTGLKNPSSAGAVVDIDAVSNGRYEQLDPAFTYSGTGWTNWSSGEYSMGSTKYSNQIGDYADFIFAGTEFYFIAGMTNNRGIVKLYIDDVPITNGNYGLPGDTGTNKSGIDLYWSNGLPQMTAYYREGLANTTHTIRVEVTGLKNPASAGAVVDIDAFEATGSGVQMTPRDPIAEANGPYSGGAGQPIAINGIGSLDPDGGFLTQYEWDYNGDGTYDAVTTGPRTTKVYTSPGVYTLMLRVTDEEGATGTDTATVTIN